MKTKLISGDEQDLVSNHKGKKRAGVWKKVKNNINRRIRQEGKYHASM